MYGWIWRRLPFGRPGKLAGSLVLVLGAGLLLWYVIFPAIDPHLPFNNDGQVSTPAATPTPATGASGANAPNPDAVVAPTHTPHR